MTYRIAVSLQRGTGRTAALVLAAYVMGAGSAALAVSPEDKIFIVGNYPVEARAANAVAAKERAIAEGQRAAFRSLLKRLVPVTAYSRIGDLRDVKAGNLVAGYSVRSERNSTTEYIASYDFTFQPSAVRELLEAEGIPFLDRQAEPLTLLPVYRAPAGVQAPTEAFSDARGSDSWLYAWKALDLANTLTPVVLTPLKAETSRETIQGVIEGNGAAMRALAGQYQAGSIAVAQLEPESGGSRIRVTLAGHDAAGTFVLARSYRLHSGDLAYTAEAAAVVSLGIIEGRWKAVTVRAQSGGGYASPAPGMTGGGMRIAVAFNNMTQWQVISRQLSQLPEVSAFEVEGLSARGARVSLSYPGGPERLAAALAAYGLSLRTTGDGAWLLTVR